MSKTCGLTLWGLLLLLFLTTGCNGKVKNSKSTEKWDTLCVHVTAYNSLKFQTQSGNPAITAWGDTLKEGTRAIAISRDLLKKGLKHNTRVKIQGMPGFYLVKDKMHYRWKKRIDVYMGKDVKKAREFGKQELEIYYPVKKDTLGDKE